MSLNMDTVSFRRETGTSFLFKEKVSNKLDSINIKKTPRRPPRALRVRGVGGSRCRAIECVAPTVMD